MTEEVKDRVYARYPLSSVIIYNSTTVFHFLLGGFGIILGYNFSWVAYLFGALYLIFSFGEMYLGMPFVVCPDCVYYRMGNSLCIAGLNVISKKLAREGNLKDFSNRAKGIFCHNNMYLASLVIPIIAIIPALILNFSFVLLVILIVVVGLLLFRFFVIFKKIACIHCAAKKECPNAQSMGISNT